MLAEETKTTGNEEPHGGAGTAQACNRGIDGNVLKFKPPLTTPDDDFERMLGLVADVTAFIQQTVHGRAAVHA